MTRAHRQDRHLHDRHMAAGRTATPDRHLAVADGPPPPPPPAGPPPPHGDIATSADRQVATHRIVATDSQDDAEPGVVAGMFAGLRFVHQSPGSLLDQIDYARDGAYSIQVEGWWRTANVLFARLAAVPGLTICYFVAWLLFMRLSRTLIALVVGPLLLMLLNGLPVVHWLVPDWADFTTWWAPAPVETGAVG